MNEEQKSPIMIEIGDADDAIEAPSQRSNVGRSNKTKLMAQFKKVNLRVIYEIIK